MNIAIFGANSYLAKDLITSFSHSNNATLDLYGRRVDQIKLWLSTRLLENRYSAHNYSSFNSEIPYDAIINFVGIGNPAQAIMCGASIFDITRQYDELVLGYLQKNADTKYIFLSSGAVYGDSFSEPVNERTSASIDINNIVPTDYYGIAKLCAEARHRSYADLNIIDLRVFNYFSSTMDLTTGFFISDTVRAIRDDTILQTTANNIYRDYLHPNDFYQIIKCVLSANAVNQALDCYTKAPIDKMTLLKEMEHHFGLKYSCAVNDNFCGVNATGLKEHYFSLNKRAELMGYQPTITSLEGVLQETNKILHGL